MGIVARFVRSVIILFIVACLVVILYSAKSPLIDCIAIVSAVLLIHRLTTSSLDSRRYFTKSQKLEILERQHNKCAHCGKRLDPRYTQFDHIKMWAHGGRTTVSNGQALCANRHAVKCYSENHMRKTRKWYHR